MRFLVRNDEVDMSRAIKAARRGSSADSRLSISHRASRSRSVDI
jgi:hypothetical protein